MNAALDRKRFAKLVALAESSNDNEALAAIRKAALLARGAGLSLGEAVARPSENGDLLKALKAMGRVSANGETFALKRRIAELEMEVVQLEATAGRKTSRDERFQMGRAAGYAEGRDYAKREFTATDAFQAGYRAGFEAGEKSERAATVRAYDRGLADGAASVTLKTGATTRRSKTTRPAEGAAA